MKKTYTPPYKLKGPKVPQDYREMVCPYVEAPPGTIQFDNVPVKPKYPAPRNRLQQQLRAGTP